MSRLRAQASVPFVNPGLPSPTQAGRASIFHGSALPVEQLDDRPPRRAQSLPSLSGPSSRAFETAGAFRATFRCQSRPRAAFDAHRPRARRGISDWVSAQAQTLSAAVPTTGDSQRPNWASQGSGEIGQYQTHPKPQTVGHPRISEVAEPKSWPRHVPAADTVGPARSGKLQR